KGGDDADRNREARADDALPELVEVLQKRHLAAQRIIVLVVRRKRFDGAGLLSREGNESHLGTLVVAVSRLGGSGGRRCGLGRLGRRFLLFSRCFLFFFLLLLDPDLFLERAPQLVRGLLELGQALAERAPELGQLSRSKDDERDHENDDQLGHSDRTKHRLLLSRSSGEAERPL